MGVVEGDRDVVSNEFVKEKGGWSAVHGIFIEPLPNGTAMIHTIQRLRILSSIHTHLEWETTIGIQTLKSL